MDVEVTYRVVRAMEWLHLEVGGTVTLCIDGSNTTTVPPIGTGQLHSALQLGYLEPDVPNEAVPLTQAEAAAWLGLLAAMCLPRLPNETVKEHEIRACRNSRKVAGMVYGAGGILSGPAPTGEGLRPPHLRLVG